jgi:hypothetical protein
MPKFEVGDRVRIVASYESSTNDEGTVSSIEYWAEDDDVSEYVVTYDVPRSNPYWAPPDIDEEGNEEVSDWSEPQYHYEGYYTDGELELISRQRVARKKTGFSAWIRKQENG